MLQVKKYQKYKSEDFDKAILAVSGGLSQRKASKKYGVPQATLSDYIRGRSQLGVQAGRPPVFPRKVEKDVATKIYNAAEMGIGMTKRQVLFKFGMLAKSMRLHDVFKKGALSNHWWTDFKGRNPDTTVRKPEKLTTVRARSMNPVITGNYFIDLLKTLKELDLTDKPHRIWNMDEKNSSMEHTPSKVVASKKSRNIPGRTSNSREGNTIIVGVSAAGQKIPPLIIVRGKTEKSLNGCNVAEGPVGARWTYQNNGWTEDVLGVECFKNIFLKFCGNERPQLLILDGHHSHEVLGLLDLAKENNIVVMCLPPHTPHYLQPLDRGVFGPLETYYDEICSEYMDNPCHVVDKRSWPALFTNAYNRSVIPVNIISGFRACGIVPWNPLEIPSSAFKPSEPQDCAQHVAALDSPGHPLMWVINDSTSETVVDDPIPSSSFAVVQEPQSEDETMEAAITLAALNSDMDDQMEPPLRELTDNINGPTMNWNFDIPLDMNISGVVEVDIPGIETIPPRPITVSESIEEIFGYGKNSQLTDSKSKKGKSKKNTAHRILTSDEFLRLKREEKEEKERIEKQKEERKKAREMKRMLKELQGKENKKKR